MSNDQSQLEFILDQLNDEAITYRKMFGGIGFYKEGIMFALLGYNQLHFRTDESNQEFYEALGMKRFLATEKSKGLPYHQVPLEILEDREVLKEWAATAFEVANQRKKSKHKSKK